MAIKSMINYNMHCHLLSSYCMLVIVLATLGRSISSIFLQQFCKDKYHHAYIGGEVGGIVPFLR